MTEPTQLRAIDTTRRRVAPPGDPLTNARAFLDEHHTRDGHLLIAHQDGEWRRWTGRSWQLLDVEVLERALYDHFEHAYYVKHGAKGPDDVDFNPTKRKVADLVHAIRAQAHIPAELRPPAWTAQPDGTAPADRYIPCRNGLLDMDTRRLIPHTPAFFNFQTLPFDHDPAATSPVRWRSFLRTIWPDDTTAIECLQEILGYFLSGSTDQQKLFCVIGPKRSGKGTIARVATALLGKDDVAGPTLASFATNFGLQSLIGRRLAIIGDARLRGQQTDIAERLLSISGEDTLTVDRKNQTAWVGRLPARILLLSNETPSLLDASGALASRFVLLRMTRSWYGKEDTALEAELLAELPGILNWALDGLDRLRDRGHFTMPDSSRELVDEMEDLSSPTAAFVRDRCVVDDAAQVAADQLFDAWRDWCRQQGRSHPGTVQTFGRDLRAAIPGITTTRPRASMGPRRRYYQGIGLGTVDHDDPPDPEPPPSQPDGELPL